MMKNTDRSAEELLGLQWLIRLRWIAVLGQTTMCVAAATVFEIRLPGLLLATCIGFTALSNRLAANFLGRKGSGGAWMKPLALGCDIAILTIMLYFTGGAHNPFTMFYLLHITMAVILLPAWGAWGAVALCTTGFWSLFQSPHGLESYSGESICHNMTAHLRGMVLAMVITGCGVTYFVRRLTAALQESRHTIALAREDGDKARRTMEVATLAAGIAHELATPLGTIAIISRDLETMAGESCRNKACSADARVIRHEVERCREIIENLGRTSQAPKEACKPLDWNHMGETLSGYLPEMILERLEMHLISSPKRPLLPQSRLFQCLAILIKNGVEASPPGSPVTLEAEIRQKLCIFRVTDRGPGFPPGFEERIGEPMVTTKSKAGGLGLGLYLVKAFVVEMDGELRVESGPHGETTLVMQVPLLENES